MYVRHLRVQNLKLLRDFKLDFVRSDGTTRLWTVIVGENGLCKTSILRALALAAVGPERGNQLADTPSLPDRRLSEPRVSIGANFEISGVNGNTGHAPRVLRSQIDLAPSRSLFRGSSRWLDDEASDADPVAENQARTRPEAGWFVAGYGVDRRLPVALSSPQVSDVVLSRLNPLFDGGPIVGTGFADQLEPDLARAYAGLLRKALVKGGLLPRITDLVLSGRGGVSAAKTLVEANRFAMRIGSKSYRLPATWLSQGYQASIAWVADLIGQMVLESNKEIPLERMEGLVLIDELDLFLHPRWQVRFIEALKGVFPRMQFVATTHSPMVLPGLERDEVVILDEDDRGNVVATAAPESPKLLTGSEIYSLFFGIRELHPSVVGRALQRFTMLASDPERTDAEEEELRDAEAVLHTAGIDPGAPPVPRQHPG
jgi:hypothetical protein